MMQTILTALVGFVASVGTVLGGVATFKSATATKQKTVADSQREWIDRLEARLDKQDVKIDELRRHSHEQDTKILRLTALLSTFRRHTWPLIAWIDSGAAPPPPSIDELRALLRDD